MAISSPQWNFTLQWRYNKLDGVSNHQHVECLLTRSFKRRSKKSSKLRVSGLCEGEFTGQRWFPPTKGQLRGNDFHLVTSSCYIGRTASLYWISAKEYSGSSTKRLTLYLLHRRHPTSQVVEIRIGMCNNRYTGPLFTKRTDVSP